ncbi:hypothetical protein A2642_01820 [Candidatus Nomurabacteria bacterium RIFCSPHIGHO2_01_FULL_39_10]|uniref:Polymerase beta nucleotidyltransferase domain-containing protein n=1 Tax=Candidatus Nomurabacteria bacterium RIFCSPHIGHO2_01_FULL_39_10 TaxID=1801733 RepID=A0A1F6V4W4_9BACT|nr:MAG: hypothetical protein A2642_01820 [Candidatus Nomurabacteria bacterium RIFCSPHIGHO2_01_FULL_39_10]
MVLTQNEQKVISYLFHHYREQLSINGLAKKTNITPKGTHKILLKLQQDGLVIKKTIANANIYLLNFQNEKTQDIVQYVLKSTLSPNSYVKVLQKDLEPLYKVTNAVILFGSTLHKGMQAQDIDLLIILNKNKLSLIQSTIKEIKKIIPKKIHPIFQTTQDIQQNIQKQDPVLLNALQKNFILKGHNLIYSIIKHDASRKEN